MTDSGRTTGTNMNMPAYCRFCGAPESSEAILKYVKINNEWVRVCAICRAIHSRVISSEMY